MLGCAVVSPACCVRNQDHQLISYISQGSREFLAVPTRVDIGLLEQTLGVNISRPVSALEVRVRDFWSGFGFCQKLWGFCFAKFQDPKSYAILNLSNLEAGLPCLPV